MYYFSVNSEDNRHLGFLVLMMADEHQDHGDHGFLALKAQAEPADQQACAEQWRVLTRWAKVPQLAWRQQGEAVVICDADGSDIGRLQQQFLRLGGQHFVLNDLTGTV